MAERKNYESNELIVVSASNDSVYNYGDFVTVSALDGNDLVVNGGYWESERGGKNFSVTGGKGNDTITSHGSNSVLDGGDNDDLIYNGYRYSASSNYFYSSDDSNYNGDNSTIFGGAGNDSIKNRGNIVTINAGDGDDSVDNYGDSVSINAGDGDDYIYNYGDSVTISTGAGNDSVRSYGNKNVLVLTDGGQTTVNGEVTVKMGAGNNTLTGDSAAQIYQYVGGNDLITNYSGEDTIQITSGKIDSYSFDGGDLIFKIGTGSLRLKNMTNHAITVKDSSGKTTTKIYGNGYSPQQVIKNFVGSMVNTALDSRLKLDEAIQACSGFNSLQEVIDKMVADCRSVNNAEIFLRDYCGIILDNDDRDAVVGWDAGGLTMKTQSDLFPQSGDAVYPKSTTFTIRGLTITVPEKDTLSEKEQLVVQGFYSWWAEEAIKLIEETFGISFDGQSMTLSFFENSTAFAWGYGGSGGISVNLSYTSFNETDKNGGGLGDYLFPHEMTHVLQGDFNIWSYMPDYMTEGMADLTAGNTRYMTSLASDSTLLAQYLDPDNTFSSDTNVYAVGYMFWRYLMKQASDSYDDSKNYSWKDGSSIVGTNKAEFLTFNGKNQTISAGAGNDTITAYGEKSKIFGEAGDDYILTGSVASGLNIDAGDGNDTIDNSGNKVTISAGIGKDSVSNSGDSVTINVGDGDDSVANRGDSVSIDGGDGDDTITNDYTSNYVNGEWVYKYSKSVKIDAGNGNDSIRSYADSVTVDAGIGNDFIINGGYWTDERGGKNFSVTGGKGNDTITSHGSNSVLDGGDNDDLIYNGYRYYASGNYFYDSNDSNYNGDNSTIIGGRGNDKITNRGNSVLISAGSDNDSVYNYGNSVSVDGGDNNDIIVNGGYFESERGGKNFSVTGGNGNDTITSHGSNSVLDGGDNDDLIYNGYRYYASGNYFYDSNDSNYNGDNSTIIGGRGNDKITNRGNSVLISAGSDNDSVYNYGNSVSVDGGDNNDIIVNGGYFESERGGKNFSVTGGNGNDTITSHGSNSVLDGGDNDDLIYNGYRYHESGNYFYASNDSNYNGDNSKIIGGAGNDTIKNRGNKVIFQYSSGNGNDIIEGFNATSTLSISGSDYSSTKSGNDVIVTVGTGKITLQGAASLSSVNVIGKQTDPTKLTVTDKTSSPVTIGSAVETVDASKRTKAVKITGNALANSIVGGSKNDSLYGGKGNDSILGNAGNDKLYGEVGNDFLWGGAGNDTLTGGDGNDVFIYSAGKDVIADYATGDKISLGAAISKSSVKGSDVVFTIGSGSLTVKNGKGKTLNLIDSAGKESSTIFGNDVFTYSNSSSAKVTLGSSYKTADASKRTKAIQITGNDLANSIVGGSKNDSLYGGKGADTLRGGSGNDKLFGEVGNDLLSGGTGNDTLTGGDGDDIFIYSAGKDVILDYATGDKISLGAAISKSSVKGADVIFTIGSGSLTVKNGKGKTLNLIDSAGKESSTIFGNDVFTYSNSSSAKVTLGSSYKTADASKRTKAIQITGNDLANSIVGGSKNDSLYGGKGADTLRGGSGNDKLFGEVGNDLLSGGTGNDTLTGGDGDDIFIYSAGKDVIADYATGDKISLGAAISKSSVKGSDVVFTIGSGSLTVKNGKGKTLNLIDSAGKESSTIFGGDVFTYSDSSSAKVTLGSSYKTADASKRTKAIQITGNDLANSIVGGSKNDSLYGGKGADTLRGGNGNDKLFGEVGNDLLYGGAGSDSLWGGAGNDSLWGDAGADTFIYSSGDGKDVIFGFDDTDMLEITGAFSASYNKSKNQIAFKVGSTASAITLRDFTATTFNINGDDYKISGTKLVKS